MSRKHAMGRRSLLKGLAAGAAAAPFVGLRGARATTALPKLVVFAAPNSWMVGWNGRGSGAGWAPGGIEESGPRTERVDLPDRLPRIFEPLDRFGNDLVMIDGLQGPQELPRDGSFPHSPVAPHQCSTYLLTGKGVFDDEPQRAAGGDGEWYADGRSIDQMLAEKWGSPVLGLSGRGQGFNLGDAYISHRGPNRAHVPFYSAQAAAEAVYGVDVEDPVAVARATRRQAMLGVLGADAAALGGRLPAREARAFNAHAEALAALRAGTGATTRSCGSAGTYDYDANDDRNVPRLMADYADLMADALACGATRVGYMITGNLGGDARTRWPGLGIDEGVADHSWNHAFEGALVRNDLVSGGYDQAAAWEFGIKLQQAHMQMFGYLLERLSATPDVDGSSVLDNTIVLFVRPMRTNHQNKSLFSLVAGGRNLGVRGGRFIRARRELNGRTGTGRPILQSREDTMWHADLLTGIAQHLGAPEIDRMGYAEGNTSPLSLGDG